MGLEQKAVEGFRFEDDQNHYEFDHPQDECGVLGLYMPGANIGGVAYEALMRQQHRGQSGAGIAYTIGDQLIVHKGKGRIDVAIPEISPLFSPNGFSTLEDSLTAVGHTRYSTDENDDAFQPLLDYKRRIAVSLNGQVQLAHEIAERSFGVDRSKSISDSDSIKEMISSRMDKGDDALAALHAVLPTLEGSYCLTLTDGKRLIAARDPWGTHPLSLAKLKDDKGYVVASETAAFKFVDTEYERDIVEGEIVVIDEDGVHSSFIDRVEEPKHCMFEYIYFAKPTSEVNGVYMYAARKAMGKYLAIDHDVDVDIVVGVPNSGMAAAAGFAEQSSRLKVDGLIKDDFVGRTFIERELMRALALMRKFDVNVLEVAGKKIALVDDSVIKGNTTRETIAMLRKAGAKEIHVLSAAPRYANPCYGGMDTRDISSLIAAHYDDEGIAREIDADSIRFNSVERVKQAINDGRVRDLQRDIGRQICDACHTGNYPYAVTPEDLDLLAAAGSGQELALYQA